MSEEELRKELKNIKGVDEVYIDSTSTINSGVSVILYGDVERVQVNKPSPCVECSHNTDCKIQSDYMEFWNKYIDNIERGEFYCRKFSKK